MHRRFQSAAAVTMAATLAWGMLAAAGSPSATAETPAAGPPITFGQAELDATAVAGWFKANGAAEFGGVWLDPTRTCQHVNLTKPDVQLEMALRSASPYPALLCFNIVPRNEAATTAMARQVEADRGYWRAQGVMIYGYGEATDIDKIRVQVSRVDNQVSTAVERRYGGAVSFVQGHPFRKLDAYAGGPPWAAGMEIDDWNYECTAGYQGYQYDSLSGLTTYYLVTAGHCFHPGEIIEHSVYVVGTVQDTHYFNGSGNDSQLISMDALSASPNFFINSTAQRTFTGVDHTPQVGGQVCKFGITSGYTCANISAMHQTVTYVDGVTLTNQIIADNPGTSVALPGDSGSAMWNYTQDGGYHIDGILSGGSEGDSPQGQEVIFSDVDIINQNEGITAYTG